MKIKLTILISLTILSKLCDSNHINHKVWSLLKPKPAVIVTATMYNPTVGQCDSDPFITAGMYRINPNKASKLRWVALSRNLLSRWGGKFDYGDMIRITNAGHKDGIYKIVDTMNKRYVNRLDFLESRGTKHYKFNDVKISLVASL